MLRYMTAGESHGKGEVAILDGIPSGLRIDEAHINTELARRMYGYGRGGRMKIEKDQVDIISGCRRGMTIGSPVSVLILNKDFKINELPDVDCPRPGHADLAGALKYDTHDCRDILERASARETVARVAIGAVARIFLMEFGIDILSHVVELGGIKASVNGLGFDEIRKLSRMEKSRLRCADKKAETRMCAEIDAASAKGDTLGGVFEVIVKGCPPGLGSYTQWDKRLDGILSRAVMSIPAVKAVSIGDGLEAASKRGSLVHDEIAYEKKSGRFTRSTNHAGGIEGGMTNSMDVVVKGFMKPIATLKDPLGTVNITSKAGRRASTERSDVTAVPACGVIAEAVIAFEIASAMLDKFGGDSMREVMRNYGAYIKNLKGF